MEKEEIYNKIKSDFCDAVHLYFDSENSTQGKDDADTVFQIFLNHWRMVEVYDAMDELDPPDDDPTVIDLDIDGVSIAHTYGSVFDSGVLKSLDIESRQEMIEACIYALNSRQIRFENEVRARWYEQNQQGFKSS